MNLPKSDIKEGHADEKELFIKDMTVVLKIEGLQGLKSKATVPLISKQ